MTNTNKYEENHTNNLFTLTTLVGDGIQHHRDKYGKWLEIEWVELVTLTPYLRGHDPVQVTSHIEKHPLGRPE